MLGCVDARNLDARYLQEMSFLTATIGQTKAHCAEPCGNCHAAIAGILAFPYPCEDAPAT